MDTMCIIINDIIIKNKTTDINVCHFRCQISFNRFFFPLQLRPILLIWVNEKWVEINKSRFISIFETIRGTPPFLQSVGNESISLKTKSTDRKNIFEPKVLYY